MLSPRWQKLLADLSQAKQRVIVMVIAMAAGLFSVTVMLDSYSILTREIVRNYRDTEPASATLELTRVDEALVTAVRRYPGIADAEARATVLARIRVGDDWMRLLLFVINDFNDIRLNRFNRESGAWPPPRGTMLVERSSLRILEAGIGAVVRVKTPHHAEQDIGISGLTHDPGLAPAVQEQTVYGYITRETLKQLGEQPLLDELRVLFTGHSQDRAELETAARRLAGRLESQGHAVRQIQAPPPGRHPHQGQMTAVLFLFIAFSFLSFVLSAILVATLISAMLAKQVREIGVMKAIGAGTSQIAAIYLVMAGGLGVLAAAVSVPLGLHAAGLFSDVIAKLLNFTITSYHVPRRVYVFEFAAGVLAPLLAAAIPVLRGSRVTVREAINDYGVKNDVFGGRRLDSLISGLRGLNRTFLLALRNTFRRRGRLVLSLSLLAAGGGMFMTSLNVRDAWQEYISRIYTDRRYDVELRLHNPERVDALLSALNGVQGIRKIEAWGFSETAPARSGMIDLVRTYPDGGHGSFLLLGVPPDTTMVKFPLMAGRWLLPEDTDGVVLNQMARGFVPGAGIGDEVALSLDGKAVKWHIIGIVEEIGSPAAAYVTDRAYARAAGSEGRARMLRISSSAADQTSRIETLRTAEAALESAGMGVRQSLPLSVLKTAIGEHITVLVNTLIAAAALLGLIGILGLASAMSMNVIERTRELGVMRVIGAAPASIIRIIVTEGVCIGALSWIFAIVLSLPLSLLVGRIVGLMAFQTPLTLVLSPFAMALWLGAVLAVSALACAWPAYRASRLTVREALAYE